MKTSELEPDLPQPAKKPGETAIEDRRHGFRYQPVVEKAYLGWWEAESFRAELGVLRNISAGGAAVELESRLAHVDTVWFCVAGPGRVTWTPARLAGQEGRVLRLSFTEPFPNDLFELLVWGFDTSQSALLLERPPNATAE
ncbi:MAG: hypothetical protein P4L84_28330 [Isosphaeraceae bacterium]|nr:hypothetical protein [Isosphaeraceae bacterium]